MDTSPCIKLHKKASKCIKRCVLLEIYADKCDKLSKDSENIQECKRFLSLVNMIVPKINIKK